MKKYTRWMIGVLGLGMALAIPASAQNPFEDDFEAYSTGDPAVFVDPGEPATTNWFWNGLPGAGANNSRIFSTSNYGGTRLWICSAAAAAGGTGITSKGIELDSNTDYQFLGNLVCETAVETRTATFEVDLLIGADTGTAVSVIGGATNVTGRGDGDGSYADQVTTIPFTTGTLGPTDRLFIEIVLTGTDASNPFAGVDNISIVSLADADMDGLLDQWEIDNFGSITNWTGADDPDFDSLNNIGEVAMTTEPLNPDTDDDGLTDGVETDTGTLVDADDTGSSPLVADTDGDGVIDGAEIHLYGADPNRIDSDQDEDADVVEITLGGLAGDPNPPWPSEDNNLLNDNMPQGTDWTDNGFFTAGSAAADDVWVIGSSLVRDLDSLSFTFGELIRNPEGASNTFPGPALIISGEGAIFRMKQDNGETVTVDDLRLRGGGQIDNGNAGMTLILDGAVTVEAGAVSNLADVVTTPTTTNTTFSGDIDSVFELFEATRGIIVDASLAGDSGLSVRQGGAMSGAQATLRVRSLTNDFTGGWTVEDVAILKGAGLVSLGSGDITLNGGILDADYNLALMDSTLTVGTPGSVLMVDQEHYVGALIVGASNITAGTYTAAQLVAASDPAYSNSFVDGGGTVNVTGLGSGDGDGDGLPDQWEIAESGGTGLNPNDDADVGGPDGLTVAMEFAAGTDPLDRDTDGDTLLDGAEIFTHGTNPDNPDTDGDTLRDDGELVGVDSRPPTNPTSADTDGDGLSDLVESNTGTLVDENDTGTDPTDPDTDGDLFADGVEIAEGSDPLDPTSVPTGFFDDFEAYPVSNPAVFVDPAEPTMTNWTWNGVGTTGNDSRIFASGNFVTNGTTRLWICNPGSTGSGITSAGIGLESNTLYTFVGNLVGETFNTDSQANFTVDLRTGTDTGTAVSVIGGPVAVIGRGDGDNSYTDQVTSINFNSGAMTPGDRLFIDIVYTGPGPNSPWAGVDNIGIVEVADSDGDLLPDQWEIGHFGSITNWVGTDDPDMDLLDNLGELERFTDPLNPDTDDDDLTDFVETGTGVYMSPTDTGTDPLDPDTDDDGLEDGVETDTGTYVSDSDTGTDPNDGDTDDDTFGDGVEIAAGSDPFVDTSVPEWCSGAFAIRYEADADVASVENAAEGWVEADTAAEGAGVVWTNGYLLIDSYDVVTNSNTAGGLWTENPAGGAWGAAVGSGNPSYTYEVRARILADAGTFGLVMWSGHAGDPGIATANISTNAVYWGLDQTMAIATNLDNSTDFHVYRIYYNAETASYAVYRDNVLVADELGAGINNTQTRLILGDIGGAGSVRAEVDYVRWDVGIPWTPDDPTSDCDGDGLLNNEEDLNGNGSTDPGETAQGNPDTDGDGSSDGDEVLVAGTDPTDADSVMEVVDAADVPAGTVEWASVPGKTYRVQFRASLSTGDWTDLTPDVPASGTGTTSYTDPAGAGAEGYYRVLVLAAP